MDGLQPPFSGALGIRMNIFNFFGRKTELIDGKLGRIEYDDNSWAFQMSVGSSLIDVSIDGSKEKPDEFAKQYWLSQKEHISDLWLKAINFSKKFFEENFEHHNSLNSNFTLDAISIHKEKSFDKGHLVFWFHYQEDLNGSYYVSFINEEPNHLHRDN